MAPTPCAILSEAKSCQRQMRLWRKSNRFLQRRGSTPDDLFASDAEIGRYIFRFFGRFHFLRITTVQRFPEVLNGVIWPFSSVNQGLVLRRRVRRSLTMR